MIKLSHFLSFTRAFYLFLRETPEKNVTFILGNQSCDLDSISGSISLAFLNFFQMNKDSDLHLKNISSQNYKETFITNSNFFIPIINCDKNLFQMKFDFLQLSSKLNLDIKNLVFFEEIEDIFHKKTNYKIVLYDHNELFTKQNFLKNSVSGIIDHHNDKQQFNVIIFKFFS